MAEKAGRKEERTERTICSNYNFYCELIGTEPKHTMACLQHWLYSNDIEWLLVLLNDDEKVIQKFGLGILANLILM